MSRCSRPTCAADVRTVTFGDGGDFSLEAAGPEGVMIREDRRPEAPGRPG